MLIYPSPETRIVYGSNHLSPNNPIDLHRTDLRIVVRNLVFPSRRDSTNSQTTCYIKYTP